MPAVSQEQHGFGVLELLWRKVVKDYAVSMAWHHDGTLLFVGDASGMSSAFTIPTGKLTWSTHAHDGGVMAVAAHPHKPRLATAGQDGTVRLWDTKTGQMNHELAGGAPWIEHLAWSPNGKLLASSAGRHLRIWNAEGILLAHSAIHASVISAVRWSSDDEVMTACYGRVCFWDAASGKLVDSLDWKGSLLSLVMSPDGGIVACGSQDKSVHFWRRATKQDSMMAGYATKPTALAFDSTSTLLATSGGESITVWSFHQGGPEGSRPGVLQGHALPVTTVQFAQRQQRLASGAKDASVLVWDVNVDGDGRLVGGALVAGTVESVAWRQDDKALAAIDASGGVNVWRCNP